MCAPRTVSNSRDFQEIRSATSGNPKAASDTGVAAPERGRWTVSRGPWDAAGGARATGSRCGVSAGVRRKPAACCVTAVVGSGGRHACAVNSRAGACPPVGGQHCCVRNRPLQATSRGRAAGPRKRGRSPHLTPHVWVLLGRHDFHFTFPTVCCHRPEISLFHVVWVDPALPLNAPGRPGLALARRGCPDGTPHPESPCPSSPAPTSQLFLKPLTVRGFPSLPCLLTGFCLISSNVFLRLWR